MLACPPAADGHVRAQRVRLCLICISFNTFQHTYPHSFHLSCGWEVHRALYIGQRGDDNRAGVK